MKKQELLAELSNQYEVIGEPALIDDSFGVNVYDLPVFDVSEVSASKKTISFYVKNEGGDDEVAFLRQRAVVEKTFLSDVLLEIENQKSSGNILTGKVSESDEVGKFAIVKAFLASSEGAVQKDYLYRKNGDNMEILLLQ